MRRVFGRFLLSAAAILFIIASPSPGVAQPSPAAATPAPGGVTTELIGSTPLDHGQRLDVYRVTLGPHASVPLHAHPGIGLLWVESGSIDYGVAVGDSTVCAGGCKGPVNAIAHGNQLLVHGQPVPPGMLRLVPGDSVAEGPGQGRGHASTPVTHTYRAGAEGAVVIISRVLTSTEHDGDLADTCQPSAATGHCTRHTAGT